MLLRGLKLPKTVLDRSDIEGIKSKSSRSGRSWGGVPLSQNYGGDRNQGYGQDRRRGRGGGPINYGPPGRNGYQPPNAFPPPSHPLRNAHGVNDGVAPPGPPLHWHPPPPGHPGFGMGLPPPPPPPAAHFNGGHRGGYHGGPYPHTDHNYGAPSSHSGQQRGFGNHAPRGHGSYQPGRNAHDRHRGNRQQSYRR
ncbi:hypothetical protein SODALDRAFT_37119 [Sodiomyces alkalinus F11]|uniref:Uncharacterized protein n=1 Tax=Sodiomyces alkalinus (strain CBS 110278 / VKM F-3762 / F11) TaxID=1314773 RepID=A0A3N2Q9D4_SODAK|nr:hypothetical protein SODALDRAFT_37119 [Sodiomyces alkalinus F11]ROT43352.1 hypothetical protein SODALDRAFT_37119 [Sodiomyces alkalinus F11]